MEKADTPEQARNLLNQSIEALYEVFARYPVPADMTSLTLPKDVDRQRPFRVPLRELGPDDLGDYVWNAVTVWGHADDFRYFLPRIFELQLSTTPISPYNPLVFGKLRHGRFFMWPVEEQEAVTNYLMALGRLVLVTFPSPFRALDIKDYLCILALVKKDLAPFLELWRQADFVPALRHLAGVAIPFAGYPTLFRGGFWKDVRIECKQALEDWLCDLATEARLENAFFQYADEPFATEFAAAADAFFWKRPLLEFVKAARSARADRRAM